MEEKTPNFYDEGSRDEMKRTMKRSDAGEMSSKIHEKYIARHSDVFQKVRESTDGKLDNDENLLSSPVKFDEINEFTIGRQSDVKELYESKAGHLRLS